MKISTILKMNIDLCLGIIMLSYLSYCLKSTMFDYFFEVKKA